MKSVNPLPCRYYKLIRIPELEILKQPLQKSSLSWSHAHNTLIISYEKSADILRLEATEKQEVKSIRAEEDPNVDCKQQ